MYPSQYPKKVIFAGFVLMHLMIQSLPALAQSDGGVLPDAIEQEGGPATDQTPISDGGVADATMAADLAAVEAPVAVKKDFTGIVGKVIDGKTKEPLIEATVKVVRGSTKQALTDVDGNFKLALPPGTYDLRVFYEVYEARRITGVVVERGEARVLNVSLGSDEKAVQVVVVEAKADKRSEGALLQERKKAAAVSDSISAQEIARSPDNNAGDAVKRVVSATVTDGRYVYVRGLGGRYSSTLLNNAELPSPEPDEQSVPLDLFPTTLLSNLTVLKAYSPDLPGAFSGGVLQIETNGYPSKLDIRLKISAEYNNESTFKPIYTYDGGSADWVGVDDGRRALPAAVPGDRPVVESSTLDAAAVERIGESFRNVWSLRTRTAVPALGMSGSIGGTKNIGSRKLGYLVSANYGYRDRTIEADVNTVILDGKDVTVRDKLINVTGTQTVNLGGLANFGLQLSPNHEIGLFSLFARSTDNQASLAAGFNEADREHLEATRLRFIARTLSFTQIRGEHRFPGARDLTFNWEGHFSITHRSEPDTCDMEYSVLPGGMKRFRSEPQSGERFFSELTDLAGGGQAHASIQLPRIKLRLGGQIQTTSRTFSARRFRFVYDGEDPAVLFQPAEAMFSKENIGPAFEVQERTLQSDGYKANLTVGGGYALVDTSPVAPLRIVAGVRVEGASQTLTPGSVYSITQTPEPPVNRSSADVMPAVNAVVALTPKMNLRAAYSYTITRPKFRELAPFAFYDFTRRRALSGNPKLRDTRIHNADLRWEYFPTDSSVVALSVFYKYFADPIEQIIYDPANGDISFANQRAAHVGGAEAEARTTLAFIHRRLDCLSVGVNGSFIYSQVAIDPASAGASTTRQRPLQGQSPYVINVNLAWSNAKTGTEISLLYNVYGPRISDVGFSGLPDIYEQAFHRLDASLSQKLGQGLRLKVTGTNLANQSVSFRQGDVTVFRFNPGIALYGALEWVL